MEQNTQSYLESPGGSLAALLQFINREPLTPAILCETCGGDDQVDSGSRLCSGCQKLSQEDVEESEQAHVEGSDQEDAGGSDKGSYIELSDEEEPSKEQASDEEQIGDIMEMDFDALIKGKSEDKLIEIGSLLTRQCKHKDFATKAVKLSKVLEEIWAAGVKKFEKNKDQKCIKCKKEKVGGHIGRCGKCYEKLTYWRKRLKSELYKKCPDCREVKFLCSVGRCGSCYNKDLQKRKREALKEATKRAISPINHPGRTTRNSLRARSSQFFNDDQQSEIEQEFEQKRSLLKDNNQQLSKRPKLSTHRDFSKPSDVLHKEVKSRSEEQVSMPLEQIQSPTENHVTSPKLNSNDQAKSLGNKDSHEASPIGRTETTPPILNCFGCRKSISQDDFSPKDRICMGCFTIALIVNSRPNHVGTT
jgi:hypothetical protein